MNERKNKFYTNSIIVALIAIFCCALWGSATPFIKMGYELLKVEGGNVPFKSFDNSCISVHGNYYA